MMIEIGLLHSSPLQATINSEIFITNIVNVAKEDPASIPPIHVGKLDNEYYIIDGHARVEAFKRAGLRYINAYIQEVKSKEEIITYHIRYNKHNTFNPLALYENIKQYIEKNDIQTLAKRYWLSIEQIKSILAISKLGEDAYNKLKEYIKILVERHEIVNIPPYIIRTTAKAPLEYQSKVLDYIFINIDRTENRFSFPEEDSILAFITYIKRDIKKDKKRNIEDICREVITNNNQLLYNEKMLESNIRDVSNARLFRCNKCNTLYVINKRLNVALCEVDNRVITIKDDLGSNIYGIPSEIIDEIESNGVLRWYIIDNKVKFEEILNRAKGKILILTSE